MIKTYDNIRQVQERLLEKITELEEKIKADMSIAPINQKMTTYHTQKSTIYRVLNNSYLVFGNATARKEPERPLTSEYFFGQDFTNH